LKKKRIIFRVSEANRLSFPVLLNVWEQAGIADEFEILVRDRAMHKEEIRRGDIFLFSFMTANLPDIHQEISSIKQSGIKDLQIVGGGPHVTGEQDLAFQVGFDTLFIGPAERTFLEWGIELLDNRPSKHTYCYDPAQKDEFNTYLPISQYMNTIPPLEIMRGCFWHCKYCSTPLHDVLFKDLDAIKTYLGEMKQRGLKRVNFISPSAMEYRAEKGRHIDLDKIAELLEMTAAFQFQFLEYGIFPSEVRPDSVTAEGMALLKKYVTNKAITLGAQSGLDERLKQLQRGHLTEDTRVAIAIANDNGFLVNLDFIVGYPDETSEERLAMAMYIKELSKSYRIRTHIHHFIPLAGSPYAFRLPTTLTPKDKQILVQLKQAGLAAGGWVENEKQAFFYFDWLKTHFPEYYSRYK
jgi:B12-binding domain/radical SAM domain protein